MRLTIALGVSASAVALTASAQPAQAPMPPPAPHIMVMHHGMMDLNIDANHDGWITRAEASAAADRMFDQLDTNHDGRLTADDRPTWHGEGGHAMVMPDDQNCQTTTDDSQQGQRRVTVICHADDASAQGSSGSHVERCVIITRDGDHDASAAATGDREEQAETEVIVRADGDGDDMEAPEPPEAPGAPAPPHPPHAPHAPHPPMLMMLFANSEEMDTNHDGAISREEFRNQQLRFFDASDANHDGKIRFTPPPEPPMPPMPPQPGQPAAPPAPPAPPHH
jgi:hypothetical protein